jgi:hypothetical protein
VSVELIGTTLMATANDKSVEDMRREILPKDGKYVDQFWSGMFGTLCTFGQGEARLVWMRYSAFLVVHGLIFNVLKDHLSEDGWLLAIIGFSGLILCGVWAILNYAGWKNQNFLYWQAWHLKFDNLTLPTDAFGGQQPPAPGDIIYWTAQSLPALLGIVYCVCIYLGAGSITTSIICRSAIAVLAGTVALGWVIISCLLVRRRQGLA